MGLGGEGAKNEIGGNPCIFRDNETLKWKRKPHIAMYFKVFLLLSLINLKYL